MLLAAAFCLASAPTAGSEEDPLAEAQSLVELGKLLTETGSDSGDPDRIRQGVDKFRAAKKQFETMLAEPGRSAAEQNRLRAYIVDVESRIEWYDDALLRQAREEGKAAPPTDVRVPPLNPGEPLGTWCRRVLSLYRETDEPAGRAALARGLAAEGGVIALPGLFDLFTDESMALPREAVHEALASVGTYRVSRKMAGYAKRSTEEHWANALDVIYRALERPEREEPERPWLRAIREFHELKVRTLSLGMLERLDAMDPEGIAALGEIVYVEDFGYHTHVIELLSRKRDGRAVPPLVHLMNRFKFDEGAKVPAHEALVKIGWYAVPELIDRLDDKAAGIWISYTLRKISGQTMGTDKRKWHDWWKGESVRHPELFENPDERPGESKPPVVTGK